MQEFIKRSIQLMAVVYKLCFDKYVILRHSQTMHILSGCGA